LEKELEAKAWFSVPGDVKLIFDNDPATKWEKAVAKRSVRI